MIAFHSSLASNLKLCDTPPTVKLIDRASHRSPLQLVEGTRVTLFQIVQTPLPANISQRTQGKCRRRQVVDININTQLKPCRIMQLAARGRNPRPDFIPLLVPASLILYELYTAHSDEISLTAHHEDAMAHGSEALSLAPPRGSGYSAGGSWHFATESFMLHPHSGRANHVDG